MPGGELHRRRTFAAIAMPDMRIYLLGGKRGMSARPPQVVVSIFTIMETTRRHVDADYSIPHACEQRQGGVTGESSVRFPFGKIRMHSV
jgi:hypothetical protein